ncbi:hypothetical protein [Geobacter grbiciae]|uniref:hypothetical protein n=1 Tax=Geobacter grbiciae TaxID=155042 RepID=UPI001C02F3EE|nr:hypothetical protein [Geobacter grbiciae]MBT1077304.1 hypothetical protein [Geobacter grbiciae]
MEKVESYKIVFEAVQIAPAMEILTECEEISRLRRIVEELTPNEIKTTYSA